jgi:transcriptional regulator with XRE-family HTH domain
MRHLFENCKIDRNTLMRARMLAGDMSQRELARRACVRLGLPERAEAMQRQLSRVEAGRESWLEPEAIEALGAELDLPGVDLTEPYRWVYRNTGTLRAEDGPDPITWLGSRLPVFSDAFHAYEARGWVTDHEGRVVADLALSHPHEVFYSELMTELGDDESRMVLDPPCTDFRELAGAPAAA